MAEENQRKQEKSLSFLKKVYYSITKFEKYPDMAAEGTASAFKYLAVIMLIFSFIVSIGLVIELNNTLKTGTDYIQNELPNLTIVDGKLTVESAEVIKIDSQIPAIDQIIIDTNTDSEEQINEYVESIPTDNTGIVVLKDKAIIKAIETNQKIEYSYKDILSSLNLKQDTIDKQDIIEYLTGSRAISLYAVFFVFMIIYVYVIYLVSVLVDTLLIAILGNITVLFTKLKLKFSAIYNMSIYALTLSILLNAMYLAINCITGFEMSYFQIMYTSIAYVYLVAAIFLIRIDFEKKQAELMKIMEEQEKVKQELKEQKNEEDKEQNKEPKKDNEDENGKNESSDKEKQKSGDEPTGSEA